MAPFETKRCCRRLVNDSVFADGKLTGDDWRDHYSIILLARASMVVQLLAEVPISASLGRIGPVPAQVDGRRRRHSIGSDDGAQCDTVKDGPVVGLLDPRPYGPHDCGGFHSHSASPAHRNLGPTGCNASMSNCDVPGSDPDASMSGCDVTSSEDASMSNRDVTSSEDSSMPNRDMTSSEDASMPNRDVADHPDISTECGGFDSRYCQGWQQTGRRHNHRVRALLDEGN
jgi:hypothetical protein